MEEIECTADCREFDDGHKEEVENAMISDAAITQNKAEVDYGVCYPGKGAVATITLELSVRAKSYQNVNYDELTMAVVL